MAVASSPTAVETAESACERPEAGRAPGRAERIACAEAGFNLVLWAVGAYVFMVPLVSTIQTQLMRLSQPVAADVEYFQARDATPNQENPEALLRNFLSFQG